MSTINMTSILKKAQEHMCSSKMQKKIEEVTDKAVLNDTGFARVTGVGNSASKFIEVLQNEIQSHAISAGGGFSNGGLGATAIDALIKLDHSSPVKIGKNLYQISIWFTEDLSRDSLVPNKYDGVENIAALLNTGYSAGHVVYGVWKGHGDERRASLVERDGARFIENAIRDYMGNYANEYGVIHIEVADIYK